MRLARAALIAALGFFALVVQTLLFRDFLASLEGNEIAVGIFFGSWLIWVAIGAVAGRTVTTRRPGLVSRFGPLTLLYVPAFLVQHQLLASARQIAGIESFVLVPFSSLLGVAVLANAPVSFLSGFLFTLACVWSSREFALPVARVYILETIGAFAGGLFVTILLSRGVPAESVFLFGALILVLPVGTLSFAKRMNPTRWIAAAVLAAAAWIFAGSLGRIASNDENQLLWTRLLPAEAYRGSFTTPQSKYLFGEREGDFLVMTEGGVTESLPETEHASEIAALHLAEKPDARTVLVVGPGGLSVGERLRSLPQVRDVVWMYPDPDLPPRLLQVLPERFREEARKVEIPGTEVRTFLGQSQRRFDLVILNLPEATTLVLNRYSTREFFSLVRRALSPGGVCSIRISGGSNYLGSERLLLGASMLATLESVFRHVVLKPGEESFLIASDSDTLSESPSVLYDRFAGIPGSPALYPKEGIPAAFPKDRIAFQNARYRETIRATGEKMLLNTDDRPKALLFELLLTLRRAGVGSLTDRVPVLASYGTWILLAAILLYGLLRLTYLHTSSRSGQEAGQGRPLLPFDMQTLLLNAGLAGMAVSVVLMFCYQVRFGSLFLYVGLLSSLFMLGSAAGGLCCERILVGGKVSPAKLVVACTLLQIVFLVVLGGVFRDASRSGLTVFFIVAGVFSGFYVPLAAQGMKSGGNRVEAVAGRVEMLDHLGGASGAILAGLLMLPLLGVVTSLGLLGAAVATVNLVPWFVPRHRRADPGPGDLFDRLRRPVGYTLFGIGAYLLLVSQTVQIAQSGGEEAAFRSAAAEMTSGAALTEETASLEGGGTLTYFRVALQGADRSEGFVFPSAPFTRGIHGYGGPVPLAVWIDAQGTLRDVRLLRSRETPAYLLFLGNWVHGLRGRSLFAGGPFQDVDAVSGATLTSSAVLKTLDVSAKRFGSRILGRPVEGGSAAGNRTGGWQFCALMFLTVSAVALRYRPGVWSRRMILAVSLVLMGFVLNHQYSSQQLMSLLSLEVPAPALTGVFYFVVVLPIIAALFGNIYCGYLCPFGALQDFLGDLRPRGLALDPGKTVWRYGRFVKYVLLFLLVLLFALTRDFSVLRADPLITIFSAARNPTVILVASGVLILSFFFRRFWCRNLCPAGAFLSLFNGLRFLKRFVPQTRPQACDLGVRDRRELDCLQCDRCRHEKD
jgi:predicted membrane-bound spermidine synthase